MHQGYRTGGEAQRPRKRQKHTEQASESYPLQAAALEAARDQPEGEAVGRQSGGGQMESVAAYGAANEISPAQPPALSSSQQEALP